MRDMAQDSVLRHIGMDEVAPRRSVRASHQVSQSWRRLASNELFLVENKAYNRT